MRSVTLGSLRTHTRRYVAALLAVTIAVGFVVVTNALASATKNGLSAGVVNSRMKLEESSVMERRRLPVKEGSRVLSQTACSCLVMQHTEYMLFPTLVTKAISRSG